VKRKVVANSKDKYEDRGDSENEDSVVGSARKRTEFLTLKELETELSKQEGLKDSQQNFLTAIAHELHR